MTPGRPIGVSLLRGSLAVVANPGLVAAQLLLSALRLGALGLTGIAVVVTAAYPLVAGRLPAGLDRLLRGTDTTTGFVAAALFGTVVLTLYLAAASYLSAGTSAVLLTADRASDGERVSGFRAGEPRLFRRSARHFFWRFFWLENLFAAAVSLLVVPFAGALLVLVFGLVRGEPFTGLVLTALSSLLLLAGGVVCHVALLSAERSLAAGDLSLAAGVRAGVARFWETARPSLGILGLVFLVVGGGAGTLTLTMPMPVLALPGDSGFSVGEALVLLAGTLVESLFFGLLELAERAALFSLWNGSSQKEP